MARIVMVWVGILGLGLLGNAEAADALTAGSPTRQAAAQVPVHLQWALDNANRRPPPEVRRAVGLEDKAWLVREYRRQSRPSQRIAVAWLLAYVGDDEVFRLFADVLRLGPGSRTIEQGDFGIFTELLYGMGVIAQTNDLGFQFLTEAINPDWWRKERKWRERGERPGLNAALTSDSLCALGLSARPEAGVILDRMMKEGCKYVSPSDPTENSNLAVDVHDAKRYLEVGRKMGRQAFRDELFGAEFKRYSMEWRRSEEGLKWLEWSHPRDAWPWIWEDVDAYFKFLERDR